MKIDKKYFRKSISDNNVYPINLLVRFAKDKEGSIIFDPDGVKLGRGAYCLKNQEDLEMVFKKRLLNKAFKQNISPSIYEYLWNEVLTWLKKIPKD
ncbi:YlxR family protein [Metamycoplasma buccale]|uniref:YlxR family protein n=1 Tax=Metamycoplasma buccale TaxID=55602 RepID=UPI00398EABE7